MADFFNLGGIAGFVSLLWQIAGAVRRGTRRPRIHIHPFEPARDLRPWQVIESEHPELGGRIQLAVTLDVSNAGPDTAKRCVATLEITSTPPGVTLRERRYALHWADVDYSLKNTGAQPVDIGSEVQRLDVAFTHEKQDVAGCWIATPLALSLASIDQAYLQPGDYHGTLRITCENGKAAHLEVVIHSPKAWRDLNASFGGRQHRGGSRVRL